MLEVKCMFKRQSKCNTKLKATLFFFEIHIQLTRRIVQRAIKTCIFPQDFSLFPIIFDALIVMFNKLK
jgi:hypothetical protein